MSTVDALNYTRQWLEDLRNMAGDLGIDDEALADLNMGALSVQRELDGQCQSRAITSGWQCELTGLGRLQILMPPRTSSTGRLNICSTAIEITLTVSRRFSYTEVSCQLSRPAKPRGLQFCGRWTWQRLTLY
jgi:hypothetical protein